MIEELIDASRDYSYILIPVGTWMLSQIVQQIHKLKLCAPIELSSTLIAADLELIWHGKHMCHILQSQPETYYPILALFLLASLLLLVIASRVQEKVEGHRKKLYPYRPASAVHGTWGAVSLLTAFQLFYFLGGR